MWPEPLLRRGRRLSATLIASLLLVLACNKSETQHAPLKSALAQPIALLCSTMRKEGGGCNGDCSTFLNAEDGRAYRRAAELLARLPIIEDPHTEADIAGVRGAAEAVSRAYGDACNEDVDRRAPLGAAVTQCADARQANRTITGALFELVGQLAADTKSRVGVELPSTERCPEGS